MTSTREERQALLHVQLRLAGYTQDRHGHWLYDGEVLTDPYEAQDHVYGTNNDYYCFDYAILSIHVRAVILHSVINSETGSFIQDGSYRVVAPEDALAVAQEMMDEAHDWFHTGPEMPEEDEEPTFSEGDFLGDLRTALGVAFGMVIPEPESA